MLFIFPNLYYVTNHCHNHTLCIWKLLHNTSSPCLILTLVFNHKFESLVKFKYPILSPLEVVHIQERIRPSGIVHWKKQRGNDHTKHLIWMFNLCMLQAKQSDVIPLFTCHSSIAWIHNIPWVSLGLGGHLSTFPSNSSRNTVNSPSLMEKILFSLKS